MNDHIISYIDILRKNGLLLETNVPDALMDAEVLMLTYDSRAVETGTLFVCKGNTFRAEYLDEAVDKGILAYVSEIKYSSDVPYILVSDDRKALALLSALYTGYPESDINMIGLVGTKGKTTTAYYLKYVLDDFMKENGRPDTAIISSVDTYDGVIMMESVLTTPESLELHEHIRHAVDSGMENLVMEVSSQALKIDRTYGIMYDIGVFLNISEDHISDIEHKDYEDYITSKLKIFDQTSTAVVNANTQDSDRVFAAAEKCEKLITFGVVDEMSDGSVGFGGEKDITAINGRRVDIYAYDVRKDGTNTVFRVRASDFDEEFVLTMPGLFNVENALAVIASAIELGVPLRNIKNGLREARVSGRMEVFESRRGNITVIVDYAHNKLSLENLYRSTIKEYPDRKIITVFGCPGNHAENRRKDLGELAAVYSHMNYLTMEDPRNEDPEEICGEIASFIEAGGGRYRTIIDRGEAIRQSVTEAEPDSVILVIGKGRETVQYVKGNYVKCKTDIEYVTEALRELEAGN